MDRLGFGLNDIFPTTLKSTQRDKFIRLDDFTFLLFFCLSMFVSSSVSLCSCISVSISQYLYIFVFLFIFYCFCVFCLYASLLLSFFLFFLRSCSLSLFFSCSLSLFFSCSPSLFFFCYLLSFFFLSFSLKSHYLTTLISSILQSFPLTILLLCYLWALMSK